MYLSKRSYSRYRKRHKDYVPSDNGLALVARSTGIPRAYVYLKHHTNKIYKNELWTENIFLLIYSF